MTNAYKEHTHALGYVEALPKPSVQELAEHYEKAYYQQPQGSYSIRYTPEEFEYFANIAKVAQATASRLQLDHSMLDLGCGEGYFAKSFQEFGWDVACSDFSEFGISKHNPHLLPCFLAGDIFDSIERYKEQGKQFGLLNLQNVFEHVIDPEHLLKQLKPILHENGALRIMVPNDYSALQTALMARGDTSNTWFCPPEHLSYFNAESLHRVLEQYGYKVVSLQATFPIELFLANPHSNYWKQRELGKGAHFARVFCENFLIAQDMDAYIAYTEASAKLSFGRNLIAYAVPA